MDLDSGNRLDLRGTPCPMNFVLIKLELDNLPPGAVLQVIADGGDTGRDILCSLEQQGFRVREIRPDDDYLTFEVRDRQG